MPEAGYPSLPDILHFSHGQQARVADTVPVDGIRDLHRSSVVSAADHLFDLLDFNIKLVFIHFFRIS